MDTDRCKCPKTLGQARMKYGEECKESFLLSKLKKEKVIDLSANV